VLGIIVPAVGVPDCAGPATARNRAADAATSLHSTGVLGTWHNCKELVFFYQECGVQLLTPP
jgi:hypothetical protein